MSFRESISFSYDGHTSEEMGLYNVTVENGMYEEHLMAGRKIIETKVRGNDRPYFQGIEKSVLEFDLSFAFKDNFDQEKTRAVARWLDQDYYKQLIFNDNEDVVYYAMLVDEPHLVHNGLKRGYVKLKMRCDSPYAYSPMYTSPIFDFSTIGSTSSQFKFTNSGDLNLKPEIWIKKVGSGDISITNQSNGGKEFKFKNLVDGETVYVDNENEYITTDLANTYRYTNFNNNYIEMLRGVNTLSVNGQCTLQFRYNFTLLN